MTNSMPIARAVSFFFCSQIVVIRFQLVLVSVNMGVSHLGMYQVSRNNHVSNLIQPQFY